MNNKNFYSKLWKENNTLDCMKNQDFSQNLLKYTNSKKKDWKNKIAFEGGAGIGNSVIGALDLGIKEITITELTKIGTIAIIDNTKAWHKQINYVYVANLCNLNREEDNIYDITFSINCISIIQNYKKAISELVRICKPGGLIMFNVTPIHVLGTLGIEKINFNKEFTQKEIKGILEDLNCKIVNIDNTIAVKAKRGKK